MCQAVEYAEAEWRSNQGELVERLLGRKYCKASIYECLINEQTYYESSVG